MKLKIEYIPGETQKTGGSSWQQHAYHSHRADRVLYAPTCKNRLISFRLLQVPK